MTSPTSIAVRRNDHSPSPRRHRIAHPGDNELRTRLSRPFSTATRSATLLGPPSAGQRSRGDAPPPGDVAAGGRSSWWAGGVSRSATGAARRRSTHVSRHRANRSQPRQGGVPIDDVSVVRQCRDKQTHACRRTRSPWRETRCLPRDRVHAWGSPTGERSAPSRLCAPFSDRALPAPPRTAPRRRAIRFLPIPGKRPPGREVRQACESPTVFRLSRRSPSLAQRLPSPPHRLSGIGTNTTPAEAGARSSSASMIRSSTPFGVAIMPMSSARATPNSP